LANISADKIAQRVLDACLAGEEWRPADIDALVDSDSDALFRIVAEGLADRFDSRLCDEYVDIFCQAIARADERFKPEQLRVRYRHVSQAWPYRPPLTPRQSATQRILAVEQKALRALRTGGAAYRVPGIDPAFHREPEITADDPQKIVLLSRVTLGADIAVTSIVAQALRARFPEAELTLAGSPKSAELLGLPSMPVAYPRSGGMRERLQAMEVFSTLDAHALVVDPDSRLTQLGLYPVIPDDRYYFFDSRGVIEAGSLATLARSWCAAVFEVDIPRPRIAPGKPPFPLAKPAITVNLGTGGNDAKRIGGAFERDLLEELSQRAATVVLDKGFGEEEAARAERAAAGLKNVRFWEGSFAGFASLIAQSDLYVGYDSAGQHAAAALGVPLVSVFAGAVNDRFFERWRPDGCVIRVDGGSPESVFLRARTAIRAALRSQGFPV
jgi:ADP-heptose:LPS heptosyltransferase